jgi:hypothetical protein
MASSLTKRLDRLERLASELLNQNQGTVYLREGDEVPEGRKAVYVQRVFIDPPEQPQEELPETTEPSPAIERPSPQNFNRPLPSPRLGIV